MRYNNCTPFVPLNQVFHFPLGVSSEEFEEWLNEATYVTPAAYHREKDDETHTYLVLRSEEYVEFAYWLAKRDILKRVKREK